MLATRNKQFFKNKLSFRPDLQFYWELTVAISGVACFEKRSADLPLLLPLLLRGYRRPRVFDGTVISMVQKFHIIFLSCCVVGL